MFHDDPPSSAGAACALGQRVEKWTIQVNKQKLTGLVSNLGVSRPLETEAME
jgi:hypothetical protein